MAVPSAHHATVYHSGRRRYVTLAGACRDAARQRVFRAVRENGDDLHDCEDWWRPRVDRLARLYIRWAKCSLRES